MTTAARRPRGLLAIASFGVVIALTIGANGTFAGSGVTIERPGFLKLTAASIDDPNGTMKEVQTTLGCLTAEVVSRIPTITVETTNNVFNVTVVVLNGTVTVTFANTERRAICTLQDERVHVVLYYKSRPLLGFSLADSTVIMEDGSSFAWAGGDSIVVQGYADRSFVHRTILANGEGTTLRTLVNNQINGDRNAGAGLQRFGNKVGKVLPKPMRDSFTAYTMLVPEAHKAMGLLLAAAQVISGNGLVSASR